MASTARSAEFQFCGTGPRRAQAVMRPGGYAGGPRSAQVCSCRSAPGEIGWVPLGLRLGRQVKPLQSNGFTPCPVEPGLYFPPQSQVRRRVAAHPAWQGNRVLKTARAWRQADWLARLKMSTPLLQQMSESVIATPAYGPQTFFGNS